MLCTRSVVLWRLLSRVSKFRPVATSHNFITSRLYSRPLLASVLPSGEKVNELTADMCPRSVFNSRPVATSHILIVSSSVLLLPSKDEAPLANVSPFIEKASEMTQRLCPVNVFNSRLVATSHILIVSIQPLASILPS